MHITFDTLIAKTILTMFKILTKNKNKRAMMALSRSPETTVF
jgi:hypothetical protein